MPCRGAALEVVGDDEINARRSVPYRVALLPGECCNLDPTPMRLVNHVRRRRSERIHNELDRVANAMSRRGSAWLRLIWAASSRWRYRQQAAQAPPSAAGFLDEAPMQLRAGSARATASSNGHCRTCLRTFAGTITSTPKGRSPTSLHIHRRSMSTWIGASGRPLRAHRVR